jgi:endonuclease/exonuclease/phosphatase family metal-dependent hydrolase
MFRNLILALAATSVVSAAADTYRFATFNVRYAGATTDTGALDWGVRGPYCSDLIHNYDFDVVGFQEPSGTGRSYRNPNTGRSQLADIEAWLPDYTVVSWDRGGTSRLEYVATAFKTARYELLDKGSFFISSTPDKFSYGWDTVLESHPRVVGWLKLRDRNSGETFVYVTTHTNDGWSLDGPYGSQLVAERVNAIANGLPVMLVADFNTSRDEIYRKGLKGYHAAFHDAALEVPSDKNYSMPVSNRQIEWTYNAFHPASETTYNSGKEIDMQFYRGMRILERHIITEEFTYNGAQYPASDHFPVMVVAELNAVTPKTIYVNAGATGGNGTKAAPYGTISEAVAAADIDDTVYVAGGVYKESVNPPYSVTISGGWDTSFATQSSETILDGEGLSYPPIYAHGSINLTLDNLTVRNYTSTDMERDGGVHFRGSALTLNKVTVTGCSAVEYGGGVSIYNIINDSYAECNRLTATDCVFSGNSATNGGAMAVTFYDKLDINRCAFTDNTATASAGALYVGFGKPDASRIWFTEAKGLVTNSSFTGNVSKRSGAILIADDMPSVTMTMVNCTLANNSIDSKGGLATLVKTYGGAAIHAKLADCPSDSKLAKVSNSCLNLGHVTVVGNKAMSTTPANFTASAVTVTGGNCRVANSIIAGNYSNGTSAVADFNIADASRMLKEQRNIFTAANTLTFTPDGTSTVAASAADGHAALASMMAGEVVDGCFSAGLTCDEGSEVKFAPLHNTTFGTTDVATLTLLLRNLETMFSVDVDRDGTVGTQLKTDQRERTRESRSVPGAIEYDTEMSGVSSVTGDADATVLSYSNGAVVVNADKAMTLTIADMSGRVVARRAINAAEVCSLDISSLAPGVYVAVAGQKSLKIGK